MGNVEAFEEEEEANEENVEAFEEEEENAEEEEENVEAFEEEEANEEEEENVEAFEEEEEANEEEEEASDASDDDLEYGWMPKLHIGASLRWGAGNHGVNKDVHATAALGGQEISGRLNGGNNGAIGGGVHVGGVYDHTWGKGLGYGGNNLGFLAVEEEEEEEEENGEATFNF